MTERAQRICFKPAIEIERMTITLENLSARASSLSISPFRRIREDLRKAERLDELPLREVHAWWQDLQEDFQRLSKNHQDYLREFYGPGMEMQMKSVDFILYKQHLIRYLEEFVQDLQRSAAQIGAQLERFTSEQTEHILDLVQRSELEIPRPQSEQSPSWEAELRARNLGVWQSLSGWFIGSESTARQVLNVTNEVIRRAVQNAALLVQEEYRTIGVGMRAQRGTGIDFWVFCLRDGRRVGPDGLRLHKKAGGQNLPLSKQKLRTLIGDQNCWAESTTKYKEMVNDQIFGFRDIRQYDQLIQLLIQVRRPKLSKDFRPSLVKSILNDSLQVLTDDDLSAMVSTMEQMDQLEDTLHGYRKAIQDAKVIRNEYNRYSQYILGTKGQVYLETRGVYDRACQILDEGAACLRGSPKPT